MYIFMLSRSQVSIQVRGRMVTHCSIVYLFFALDFLLDLVCTWCVLTNAGFVLGGKP